MTILPIRPNTGSTLPKQVCHDLSRFLRGDATGRSGFAGGTVDAAALVEVAS